MKDLFEDGYVDHAIFQPAYLGEFSEGAFSGAGELHYEQVNNSGLRMQRRSPTVITD